MRSYRPALRALALPCLLAAAAEAQRVLDPETLTTETMAAGMPKLFIADIAISHIVDGKLYAVSAIPTLPCP
jgi:methylamine dehydrogenase heavy chain